MIISLLIVHYLDFVAVNYFCFGVTTVLLNIIILFFDSLEKVLYRRKCDHPPISVQSDGILGVLLKRS